MTGGGLGGPLGILELERSGDLSSLNIMCGLCLGTNGALFSVLLDRCEGFDGGTGGGLGQGLFGSFSVAGTAGFNGTCREGPFLKRMLSSCFNWLFPITAFSGTLRLSSLIRQFGGTFLEG